MSIATADGRFDYEGDESHDEWTRNAERDRLVKQEAANDALLQAVRVWGEATNQNGFLTRWDPRTKRDEQDPSETIEGFVDEVAAGIQFNTDSFALTEARAIAYGDEE